METVLEPGMYPVHDFSPFLLRFYGEFGVRYYGLAYVLGFVIGTWLIYRAAKTGRSPLATAQCDAFLFYLVAGVILGGRLGSVLFYNFGDFLHNPLTLFEVWKGGMASHGGFLGVCAAVLIFAWRHRLPALRLGDMVAMAAAPGIFLGRVANFINGELWGKVTTVPWAWIFPSAPYDPTAPGYAEPALNGAWVNPRHPSQLYGAGLEGLLLGTYMLWRFWGKGGRTARPGQLVAEFLIVYSVVRVIGEQFREPDAGLVFGLSRGVLLSLLSLLVGVVLFFSVRRKEGSLK
jgi:phosphatidylglycerol---prolipoprotein diacylglyceryl transferase